MPRALVSETISIGQWKDIADDLYLKNPLLVETLDQLSGVRHFSCVLASYPFGAKVTDKGQFHLYQSGHEQAFESKNISPDVKKLLDYDWQSMPFGVVLEGSFESHSQYGNTVAPYRLKNPGKTFSLLTVFDNPHLIANLWTEVAGCRSMLMLPKITQQSSLDALENSYGVKISSEDSKEFSKQWEIFRSLSQSKNFESPWMAQTLFFSKEFLLELKKNTTVREYLLHQLWRESSFPLNLRSHEFLWSMYLTQLHETSALAPSILQNPLIIETAKHLIKIALKAMPGYVPAVNNISGPIGQLMKIFIQDYKIRFRLPTLMIIDHYDGISPIYYTLAHHIFVHAHPSPKNYNRETVTDLMCIREVLLGFIDFVAQNGSGHDLSNTLLAESLKQVEFDFYHPKGKQGIESNIEQLCQEDPRFQWVPEDLILSKTERLLESASGSNFFNGCIRIRPKNLSKNLSKKIIKI